MLLKDCPNKYKSSIDCDVNVGGGGAGVWSYSESLLESVTSGLLAEPIHCMCHSSTIRNQ